MSANRDEILKELGLWPVWKLREPPAADALSGSTGVPAVEVPAGRAGASRALPKRPPVVADAASALPLDARAAEIARMDWPQLKAGVAGCTACPLHKGRNKTVFGVGDEQAEWMFIGEGPGADEDARGEPFVGQAGKLLDNMLAAIGLKRGAVHELRRPTPLLSSRSIGARSFSEAASAKGVVDAAFPFARPCF